MDELLLPLFPLDVGFLPAGLLPLHIFEDRCKQMTSDCLESLPARAERGAGFWDGPAQ
ncbi:MAG: hypothetical protein ACRD3T_09085 [Terriglobia bacterium]